MVRKRKSSSNEPPPLESDPISNFRFVVAIDLGTSNSGFAFAHTTRKDDVLVDQGWTGKNARRKGLKVRTAILLSRIPPYKTIAFGENAKHDFLKAQKRGKDSDLLYFDRFKMQLYRRKEEGLFSVSPLVDATGKHRVPAEIVFTRCLEYLKSKAVQRLVLDSNLDESFVDKIKWIVTVPAIWEDGAKEFMRRCALDAGMQNVQGQLDLALEPEAGALCCLTENKLQAEVGKRYMVLDAGGGTIDITCHESLGNGEVKEIRKVNGGDCGATKIDKTFESRLKSVVGYSTFKDFKENHQAAYHRLFNDFEELKVSVTDLEEEQFLAVPPQFATLIPPNYEDDGLAYDASEQQLELSPEFMTSIFNPTLVPIEALVAEELRSAALNNCAYVLLVGGFAQCVPLQRRIEKLAMQISSGIRVIRPLKASMTVVKGAVTYGLEPRLVKSRVARYCYATQYSYPFDDSSDPEHLSFTVIRNGKRQKHISRLYTLMPMGAEVPFGHTIKRRSFNLSDGQTHLTNHIYKSLTNEAVYHDDRGVTKLGEVTVEFDKPYMADEAEVETKFIFGGTCLHVRSKNVQNGREFKTQLKFE